MRGFCSVLKIVAGVQSLPTLEVRAKATTGVVGLRFHPSYLIGFFQKTPL